MIGVDPTRLFSSTTPVVSSGIPTALIAKVAVGATAIGALVYSYGHYNYLGNRSFEMRDGTRITSQELKTEYVKSIPKGRGFYLNAFPALYDHMGLDRLIDRAAARSVTIENIIIDSAGPRSGYKGYYDLIQFRHADHFANLPVGANSHGSFNGELYSTIMHETVHAMNRGRGLSEIQDEVIAYGVEQLLEFVTELAFVKESGNRDYLDKFWNKYENGAFRTAVAQNSGDEHKLTHSDLADVMREYGISFDRQAIEAMLDD